MSKVEHLPGNSTIFAVLLIILIPLQFLRATPVEFGDNLIKNPDAELGDGSNDGYDVVGVPEWDTDGNFTVVKYGAVFNGVKFPDFDSPGPDDRGNNFFSGGPSNISSSAMQIIDVSEATDEIDLGTVGYDLSGYFGGWEAQNDYATLTIVFQDNNGKFIQSAAIGSITASNRGNDTGLLFQDINGFLPAKTRQIEVLLEMNRVSSGAYNDGFADNLSLVLVPLPSTVILLGTGILVMRRYHHISRRTRHCPTKK